MLTFFILILANFITLFEDSYFIPMLVVILCLFHVVLVGFVLVFSLIDQVRRKCDDRNDAVNKMFKMEDIMRVKNDYEKEEIERMEQREFGFSHVLALL